jgi:hypothetical protein
LKAIHCILLILVSLFLVAGCNRSKPSAASPQSTGPTSATVSRQYHNELLTYAIDNLNRLEEFDSAGILEQILKNLNAQKNESSRPDTLLAAWPQPEMLRQIVDRLNQWIRVQPEPTDWQRDPMLTALPKPLAELPQVKNLDRLEFTRFDGFALQETAWLRDIGLWTRGDALDDLLRAQNLFDWTVRNIQLEPDAPGRIPLFPWETLLFGRGTETERAWVFILLARQSGIEAAVLGIEGREEKGEGREEKAEGGGRKAEEKSQISNLKSQISSPRPWCVAVAIEGHAYLFDLRLGLPIPAPKGVTFGENGRLMIQPATLAQAASDEKVLRRMDADENHTYGVKASDLQHVVVMLEASPTYLAKSMKLLESQLAGPQKMVLAGSPSAQAEHWKSLAHVGEVRLWNQPFETLQRRSHLEWKEVQTRLVAMLPFYVVPKAPLHRGRVLYLKGKFVGDDGATHYYQSARPSNAELSASSVDPIEKMMYLRAKQDASYWLGLIAYQRANYPAAVDYFMTRTLLFMPNGPWTNGARYNLARTYEISGDVERAILQYDVNADSPGYLGDLLRAKWLREAVDKR